MYPRGYLCTAAIVPRGLSFLVFPNKIISLFSVILVVRRDLLPKSKIVGDDTERLYSYQPYVEYLWHVCVCLQWSATARSSLTIS